jgi:flagellar biogenesis protein FliO
MDIARESLIILFVFALLWAALWLLRNKGWARMGRSKALPSLLESLGKLTLTARHSVHLVRIGDRNLVLAIHPNGVTFLGDAVYATGLERKEESAR